MWGRIEGSQRFSHALHLGNVTIKALLIPLRTLFLLSETLTERNCIQLT